MRTFILIPLWFYPIKIEKYYKYFIKCQEPKFKTKSLFRIQVRTMSFMGNKSGSKMFLQTKNSFSVTKVCINVIVLHVFSARSLFFQFTKIFPKNSLKLVLGKFLTVWQILEFDLDIHSFK